MNTDRRSDALRHRLRHLKEQGCNLLVVNDAAGVGTVCSRLGGDGRYARRRCYVSTTTTIASVLDRHAPSPRNGAYFGVVDATTVETVRGTAAPIQPGNLDVDAEWYTRLDDLQDFPEIVRQVESHLDRFADHGGSLEQGAIRLCVESLDPFLDGSHVDADVMTFLESVTDLVDAHDAIGHYHVASGTEPDILTEIDHFFDATIRVETTETGTVQQRWSLRDGDIETDWLPLERP